MSEPLNVGHHLISLYHRERALQFHFEQAKIPEYGGTSGYVINALCERVGREPLSLVDIAKQMCTSPRTLQRRLQREGQTFLHLIERVRHHYALDMLINKNLRVNEIHAALYYADRSSFSIAFKRWTGLAPEVFRRLYRSGYVESPKAEAQTPDTLAVA